MELVQQSVEVCQMEQSIIHQFRIGEDINVPDAKEDMARVLQSFGKIYIQDSQKVDQYLKVKGYLEYQILYATDDMERRIACMEGTINIEEMIYIDEESAMQYYIKCNELEFQSSLVHSRKVSIKALIELEVQRTYLRQEEITIDVSGEEKGVFKKFKTLPILQVNQNLKDSYRMKEAVKLAGTKENIGQILFSRMGHVKLDTRAGRDEIAIHGEFQFFCMYQSEEWKEDYVAQTIAFEGSIGCPGMEETMFYTLRYDSDNMSVDVQMDEDGEMRVLGIEATLKLDISVYEEENYQVLEDMYVLDQKTELEKTPVYLESLLLQNQSKCKITELISLPELRDELLQICTVNGRVQLEQVEIVEGGIQVEGILHMELLYIRGDDKYPYASWQGMVPFSHIIECPELGGDVAFSMDCYLEQISVTMAGNGEIEVRALVNFYSFVRKQEVIPMIQGLTLASFTREELELQAGIIGYIYKESDSMWEVAKRFHTTTEGILKNNKTSEKDIKAGQKLLIFKENISIL